MVQSVSPLMTESDKVFWHGYISFYEKHFIGKEIGSIAEIGLLEGNSIRWMLQRFPLSNIDGVDIMPQQAQWPTGDRIKYHQIDQSNRTLIRSFFRNRKFDLVVEDGSHIPEHQAHCLIEALPNMNPGGLYIVEDIHTSLPTHSTFGPWYSRLSSKFMPKGTLLSTLLAIDHYNRIGKEFSPEKANRLAKRNILKTEEILSLYHHTKNIWIFRRNHFPDKCYRCGSHEYLYHKYTCVCGACIFAQADSMSIMIEIS